MGAGPLPLPHSARAGPWHQWCFGQDLLFPDKPPTGHWLGVTSCPHLARPGPCGCPSPVPAQGPSGAAPAQAGLSRALYTAKCFCSLCETPRDSPRHAPTQDPQSISGPEETSPQGLWLPEAPQASSQSLCRDPIPPTGTEGLSEAGGGSPGDRCSRSQTLFITEGFTGGHRDPYGKHRAEGTEVGLGGWAIIQQLMEPSMAGCPAVQLLSGCLVRVGCTDWVLGPGPGGG